MPTRTFRSLAEANVAIKSDMRARNARMRKAVRQTTRQTRNWIARESVPRAFGELADSLEVEDTEKGSQIVSGAPHSAAVENGSRPHTPPLAPLIRWVQLRGVQGLTDKGGVKNNRSRQGFILNPRKEHAYTVASEVRARLGKSGAAQWKHQERLRLETSSAMVDPTTIAIARAIQHAISVRGTKPHRFMMAGVPVAKNFLSGFVADALPDKD